MIISRGDGDYIAPVGDVGSDARREGKVRRFRCQEQPVSGTALAREFGVSRQVIVQDIALLRSANVQILSTNRGYLVQSKPDSRCTRVFKCCHTEEQEEDELNCIVDEGGIIENIYVNHKAHGKIAAQMNIHSRRGVKEYIERIHSGKSMSLINVTSGYHYHTVHAESEEILDTIEQKLKGRGYLVPRKTEG